MRAQTVTTTCDLCGYGGPLSAPEDFTAHSGYDYCRWCAATGKFTQISSGGHDVTVSGDQTWACSCGRTDAEVLSTLRAVGVALGAMNSVPGSLVQATARLHVNTPNWPHP